MRRDQPVADTVPHGAGPTGPRRAEPHRRPVPKEPAARREERGSWHL